MVRGGAFRLCDRGGPGDVGGVCQVNELVVLHNGTAERRCQTVRFGMDVDQHEFELGVAGGQRRCVGSVEKCGVNVAVTRFVKRKELSCGS